jgi:hypothetical protein
MTHCAIRRIFVISYHTGEFLSRILYNLVGEIVYLDKRRRDYGNGIYRKEEMAVFWPSHDLYEIYH